MAVTFSGTPEQQKKLAAVIEKYKDTRGALIPILHDVQAIYGYLPIEVQKMISEGTGVPLSEIYGVVTFYTQFTTERKGDIQIAVCMGTACYVKGAGEILERIKSRTGTPVGKLTCDGKCSLEATRCIGACGLAPVITVNGDVYGRLVPDDVDGILDKYLGGDVK